MRAVPPGPLGEALLAQLARQAQGAKSQLGFVDELLRRLPQSEAGALAKVRVLSEASLARDPLCETIRCAELAQQGVDALSGRPSLDAELLPLRALVQLAQGRAEAAHALLLEGCPRDPSAAACFDLLLRAAAGLSEAQYVAAGDAYLDAMCRTPRFCEQTERTLSVAYERRGFVMPALALARSLVRKSPSVEGWLRVSALAQKAGRLQEALVATERAAKLTPQPGSAEDLRIQEQKKRLTGAPE